MIRSTLIAAIATLLTISAPALADDAKAGSAGDSKGDSKTDTKATEAKGDAAGKSEASKSDAAPAPEVTVLLTVKSPETVSIEREDTGEVVCTSPCNRQVPATLRYRVGGSRPSEAFTLDARTGRSKLSVDPASSRDFWLGIGGLGAGALMIGGGITALIIGDSDRSGVPGSDGTITDTGFTDLMYVGTGLIVGGVAAGIWGGATALSNRRTTVTGNIVKDPPARGSMPAKTASTDPAFAATVGRTYYVPILQGAF